MARTRTVVSLSAQLVVLLLIAAAFFMRTSPVDGLSMEPRVHAGEIVLINTLAYRLGPVRRGDVVAFHHDAPTLETYIKRVVGLPGERVAVRDGVVTIDGRVLPEPYVRFPDKRSAAAALVPAAFVLRARRQPRRQRRLAQLGRRARRRHRRQGAGRHLAAAQALMASGGGVQEAQIQWYPGHMATAMRQLAERLRIVDVVVEVRDARLPQSSANPALDRLAAHKPRLVVLGREDLADPHATREWLAWFERAGRTAVAVNAKEQGTVKRVGAALGDLAGPGPTRAMVVGIPNTGKSSIINGLLRRTAARAEDKAGVTRSLQWFRVQPKLEVMDTPGILVPKIATRDAQWQLALTGALPRERFAAEEVVDAFVAWARERRPSAGIPDLAAFASARGFARRGGELDLHNAAGAFVRAFNDAAFGRFTFELPEAQ